MRLHSPLTLAATPLGYPEYLIQYLVALTDLSESGWAWKCLPAAQNRAHQVPVHSLLMRGDLT
ncbi:Uncharacterised protein [Vibrio cholerae]|nr:Uncharacterised protein [Vibrio cholerae]